MTRLVLIAWVAAAAACGSPPPAVGPPLRPVISGPAPVVPVYANPDCPVWDPSTAAPAREIKPGVRALAEKHMWAVQDRFLERAFRYELPAEYDDRLVMLSNQAIATLEKDPYSARALVVLAVVYAAAGRKQCVSNLMPYLVALRRHKRLGPTAEAIFDQVLGMDVLRALVRDSQLRELHPR
jgi:hypothetical protein